MDNQRLRQLVAASNESQKEIAEKLSISQQRFNFYVTGKRQPDNEMLLRIADHFGVTADYLLGHSDTKKEPSTQSGELSLDELLDRMTNDELFDILDKASKRLREKNG